jgi:hypothetical protein
VNSRVDEDRVTASISTRVSEGLREINTRVEMRESPRPRDTRASRIDTTHGRICGRARFGPEIALRLHVSSVVATRRAN